MNDQFLISAKWCMRIVVSIILIVLSGCRPSPEAEVQMDMDRYDNRMHRKLLVDIDLEPLNDVVLTYATELKFEKHLHLEQSFASYDNYVNKIRMQFISQDILEMDEARRLLVDVVEGLLERLNYNYSTAREMRKQLYPTPFGPEHLEITINFESYHGIYVDGRYVGWVVLEKGMAYYYAFDIYDRHMDSWHSRIEPYFKSRTFVEIERRAEENYKRAHPIPKDVLLRERMRTHELFLEDKTND